MQANFIFDENIEWQDLGNGIHRKIMAYDDNLMMTKVRFQNGAIGVLHQHFHTQMAYIESGIFEVEIAGEKKILKTGDVYFVQPNLIHGVICLQEGVLVDIFTPMREDFIG